MTQPTATERLIETLSECRDYFDDRADADQPSGECARPNEEMKLLIAVKEALSFAEKLNRNGVRA